MKPRDLVGSFRSIWGAFAGAVVAGPLGVWAGGLDPPDPPGLAVLIATPFCAVLLILCMLWVPQRSDAARRWIATALLGAGLVVLMAYLASYFGVVVHQPKGTAEGQEVIRVVVGSTLREGIEARGRTATELLLDYAFEPKRIWTEASLGRNQLRLHALFTAGFALLTAGVGVLAVRGGTRLEAEPGTRGTE